MVFKKLMRRLGVGGPTVDTVLSRPDTQPGRTLTGRVNITGGDHDVEIEAVVLSLVVRAETESGDHEYAQAVEFSRLQVAAGFAVAVEQEYDIPFELAVPWETPITHVNGEPLRGMAVGVRTELAVAKAVDKGDLDAVNVHPLASQEAVLEAFARLGCAVKHADVETGRIAGLPQELPFFQEIEYYPPGSHAGVVNEVELTFVADPERLAVVLEADRRGGVFGGGGDSFGRFQLSHAEAENFDWTPALETWLSQVAERSHHGGHHGHGHHGGGIGMGGVAAGAAAGFVGGMVAAEVMDDMGDAFFGDEE